MQVKPWPYFRQRKAKVVPLYDNVIPINHRSAFNPSPLLPRKMLRTFEASLYRELSRNLNKKLPVELIIELCLTYRPSSHLESTAALGWARLIAKDLRWRIYEGTYEYILFNGYFVKLIDKGISVQAILLAWIKEVSLLVGEGWLWKTRDELLELANSKVGTLSFQRLHKAWLTSASWEQKSADIESPIVRIYDYCQLLDQMEQYRNLLIRKQLEQIAPRVEEHLRPG